MRRLALALLCLFAMPAFAADVPVVLVTVDCHDYFVVDLGGKRYALVEWYGGYRPQKGDVVSGDFSHFGVQDVTVKGGRLRIYPEDYDLDMGAVNGKLGDKCK